MKHAKKLVLILFCLICPFFFFACNNTPEPPNDIHIHKWDEGEIIVAPTCSTSGLKIYTCIDCNETKTEKILHLGHSWSDYLLSNEETHWNVCIRTGCEEKNIANHEWNNGIVSTEPSCIEKGLKTFTCIICSTTKTANIEELGHNWEETYQYDDNNHWHVCLNDNCDQINSEKHNWNNGETTISPTCEDVGETTFKCIVCQKTKTQELAPLGHRWSKDYNFNNIEHWLTCLNEECSLHLTNEHNYNSDGTCRTCGFSALNYQLLDDETYSASLKDGVKIRTLTIPEKYNEKAVTTIPEKAFYSCSTLTRVIIPKSVTTIGFNAFNKTNSLKEITLPFIGRSIDDLENAYPEYVFGYSKDAVYKSLPSTLTKITILSGNIPDSAFAGNLRLTSVVLESGVTNIGIEAFRNCENLETITLSNNITYIGAEAFACCRKLKSLTIPNKLTEINDGTFSQCATLTSVVIPDSVLTIGEYAFGWCDSLAKLTIGRSVNTIDVGGFYGCNALIDVYIPDVAMWCNIEFGSLLGNPLYYAKNLYVNNILTKDLIIKNTNIIKKFAFADFKGISSVYIGKEVTTIKESVFTHCIELETIEFERLDGWRFYGNWGTIDFSDSKKNVDTLTYMYSSSSFVILDE